jgi:hypothetical protein
VSVDRGDYTARDYDSIRAHLKAMILREYPELGLDLDDDSISLEAVQLDTVCGASDLLNLYIDAAYSEMFLDSAVTPQALRSHSRNLRYPIGGVSAATATFDYTYTRDDPAAPVSLFLALGTALPNDSGYTWTVVTALQAVSEGTGTFEAYQGSFVTDSFTADGSPDQTFDVTRGRVAGNVSVRVDVDGVSWSQVDDLTEAGSGEYFEVRRLGYGDLRIVTGDGTNGDRPSGNVVVTSFVTDGDAGNCPAAAVSGEINPDPDVTLEYSNSSAVRDGSDGESVEDVRRNAPAHFASSGYGVTLGDFRALVESQPGVSFAGTSFDEATRRAVVRALSSSYDQLTDAAIARLSRTIRGKGFPYSDVVFRNVDVVKGYVALRAVFGISARGDTDANKSSVEDAVETFFRPGSDDEATNGVGKSPRLSDFFRAVDSVPKLDHLNVDVFTREPTLEPVRWTTSGDAVELGGWHIRPTSVTLGSAGIGTGITEGLGTLNEVGAARLRRYSTSASGAPSAMSSRGSVDNWRMKRSSSMPDVVRVKMSAAGRRYSWEGWRVGGEVPGFVATSVAEQPVSDTAHFEVGHEVDGELYPDSSIGYLGVPYETDGGYIVFRLAASEAAVSCSGTLSPSREPGYFTGRLSPGNAAAGTVTGTVAVSASSSLTVVDRGNGALYDTFGTRIGFVDYDSGWFAVELESGYTFSSSSTFSLSYDRHVFDNSPGEVAEIRLSPLVGDIGVKETEFCDLHYLSVEVSYE